MPNLLEKVGEGLLLAGILALTVYMLVAVHSLMYGG